MLVLPVGRSLFLRTLEESAAGLARDLLQLFLAVRHVHSAAAHPTDSKSPAVCFRVFEKDGAHQRVGPLCGFHRGEERDFAARIHSVRQQDQRLPSSLLAHEFVGRQEDRIVWYGPTAHPLAAAATTTHRTAAA